MRERDGDKNVCVCVRERERDRDKNVCVCEREGETETRMCVCVREGEKRVRDSHMQTLWHSSRVSNLLALPPQPR